MALVGEWNEKKKDVVNIIYVAISKETGKVMTGAKGQAAFLDKDLLRRSLGQTYHGAKAKEMYYIETIEISTFFNPDIGRYDAYWVDSKRAEEE